MTEAASDIIPWDLPVSPNPLDLTNATPAFSGFHVHNPIPVSDGLLLPPHLASPGIFRILNEILSTIGNYFDAQLDSGVWDLDPFGQMKNDKNSKYHVFTVMQSIWNIYLTIGNEHNRQDGYRQLESVLPLLDRMLLEESPVLLPYLMWLHLRLCASEVGDMLSLML